MFGASTTLRWGPCSSPKHPAKARTKGIPLSAIKHPSLRAVNPVQQRAATGGRVCAKPHHLTGIPEKNMPSRQGACSLQAHPTFFLSFFSCSHPRSPCTPCTPCTTPRPTPSGGTPASPPWPGLAMAASGHIPSRAVCKPPPLPPCPHQMFQRAGGQWWVVGDGLSDICRWPPLLLPAPRPWLSPLPLPLPHPQHPPRPFARSESGAVRMRAGPAARAVAPARGAAVMWAVKV